MHPIFDFGIAADIRAFGFGLTGDDDEEEEEGLMRFSSHKSGTHQFEENCGCESHLEPGFNPNYVANLSHIESMLRI